MAQRYVVRDTSSGGYLAERFMRGFYFTNDISQALRFKSEKEAEAKMNKQEIKSVRLLVIDPVNFN